MSVHEQALKGMRIEDVHAMADGWQVTTTGALVTLGHALIVRQRIGADRELFRAELPAHLAPWQLTESNAFRCVLQGNGLRLTVQGDSVLVLAPQQHIRIAFQGQFEAEYAQEVRGNRLLLDPLGGCGFYGIPPRPTELPLNAGEGWALQTHLARWDELWVGVYPPHPRDARCLYRSISHEGSAEAPYPTDAVIADAAQHCQILTVHEAWAADAPEWAENPPGSRYVHPKPWETDHPVPADPAEFARVRDRTRALGLELIVYLSPLYCNAPDLLGEMRRVLDEYDVDGLYFDGWCGHRDDFRPAYALIREARALLGERTLYLHSSTEPFGTAAVYLPFVYAYADYVLTGEAGRFGVEVDPFLRYCVSGHQISNAVGMWCHYGSWSNEPGYHAVIPSTEHIHRALDAHVRIWRKTHDWTRTPEELARFDREYYGRLAAMQGAGSLE